MVVVVCTGGPEHQPGDPECQCYTDPNCDPGYIIIMWGSEGGGDDISELLRTPCCDGQPCVDPIQCVGPFNEPCDCNATNDGCIDESPNVGINLFKPHQDCTILKQILEHQPTKSKIVDLQNDLNSPIEKGFNLYLNSSGDVLSTPIAPGEIDNFGLSTSSNVFGGAHLHHNGVFPMFSFGDPLALYSVRSNFNNGSNDSSLITIIMVSQYGVYATKIEDWGKLTIFHNLATGDSDILDWLNELLLESYENLSDSITGQLTGNSIAFEKAFLEFMDGYDSGVSLYKAKTDLSGWDRKALNSSGTPVTAFSCD